MQDEDEVHDGIACSGPFGCKTVSQATNVCGSASSKLLEYSSGDEDPGLLSRASKRRGLRTY